MNLEYLLDNGPELVAIGLAIGGLAYYGMLKRREWLADGVLTLDEILDDVAEMGDEVKEAVASVRASMDAIKENEAAEEEQALEEEIAELEEEE